MMLEKSVWKHGTKKHVQMKVPSNYNFFSLRMVIVLRRRQIFVDQILYNFPTGIQFEILLEHFFFSELLQESSPLPQLVVLRQHPFEQLKTRLLFNFYTINQLLPKKYSCDSPTSNRIRDGLSGCMVIFVIKLLEY